MNQVLLTFQLQVHIASSKFSGFKDGLTLAKEQDAIIDLSLSENELEILSSCHSTQRWKVYSQNLQK